jgi:hypothetical protein
MRCSHGGRLAVEWRGAKSPFRVNVAGPVKPDTVMCGKFFGISKDVAENGFLDSGRALIIYVIP